MTNFRCCGFEALRERMSSLVGGSLVRGGGGWGGGGRREGGALRETGSGWGPLSFLLLCFENPEGTAVLSPLDQDALDGRDHAAREGAEGIYRESEREK
jgi:hypothetical protein